MVSRPGDSGRPDRSVRCVGLAGLEPGDRRATLDYMQQLERSRSRCGAAAGIEVAAERDQDGLVLESFFQERSHPFLRISSRRDGMGILFCDAQEERVRFFRRLADFIGVEWERLDTEGGPGGSSRETGEGVLVLRGVAPARGRKQALRILEELGGALPFLDGYRHARNQLEELIPPRETERLLLWAARHQVGHAPFVRRGGTDLLVRALAPLLPDCGDLLDMVLGAHSAELFLRRVLTITADAEASEEPARVIHRKLRNAFRRRLDPRGQHPALVLRAVAEIVSQGAADFQIQLDRVLSGRFESAEWWRQRMDGWRRRADLAARRLRRSLSMHGDGSPYLEPERAVATACEALAGLIRSSPLPVIEALSADMIRGMTRIAALAAEASQILVRVSASVAGRQAKDHGEIARLVGGLTELRTRIGAVSDAVRHGAASDAGDGSPVEAARRVELLEALGRQLCHSGTALFEYSLGQAAAEMEDLT